MDRKAVQARKVVVQPWRGNVNVATVAAMRVGRWGFPRSGMCCDCVPSPTLHRGVPRATQDVAYWVNSDAFFKFNFSLSCSR